MSAAARALTAHEQFADLHSDIAGRLAALAHEWAAGEWSAGTWSEEMDRILMEAHTAAVVIGRTHAGDDAPEELDDRRFAEEVVSHERDFLDGFREDLEAGRYTAQDGTRDGERVASRASRYVSRITGTANAAWTAILAADTEIWWILGAEDSSNCDACPAIAEGSPYPAHSFDLWPGSNQTPCMASCRCSLQTNAGLKGFTIP